MIVYRVALLLAILTLHASAATFYVAQGGDNSDGLTWESGFSTIGEAFTAAASGDHIWVASATYAENIEFVTGVQLYGGFLGTESPDEFHLRDFQANETIIDATGTGENAVLIYGDCVLDGFTIRGGGKLEEPLVLPRKGGIRGEGDTSRSEIKNCLITENLQFGVRFFDGLIQDNQIVWNRGGAPGLWDCDGLIYRNEIAYNLEGGGIYSCLGRISSNIIHHNQSGVGGGICAGGVVENNVIFRNIAIDPTPPSGIQGVGGGVKSAKILRYNTIVFNEAYESFGGFSGFVSNDYSYHSNIIWGNRVIRDLGGLDPNSPYVQVNLPQSHYDSCIQGVDHENGNTSDDPLFVDPENGDYRLQMGSPCIDSASIAGPSTDLDGNPRPVDIVGIGRDGPGAFDMGAYEFQVPRSDLNGDGYTNHLDLMIFQQDWMKVSGS